MKFGGWPKWTVDPPCPPLADYARITGQPEVITHWDRIGPEKRCQHNLVDATPSAINLFFKGGVYDASESSPLSERISAAWPKEEGT